MNTTAQKFGYPNSLVRDYRHWMVLARPQQVTLGSLVLCSKSEASSFAALAPEAYAELGVVTADIERALKSFVQFEKINYLMLMMVDPHVHFHVIPRYSSARQALGLEFPDAAWPKPPQLGQNVALDAMQVHKLAALLQDSFVKAAA